MNWKKRIAIYILLFFAYWALTILLLRYAPAHFEMFGSLFISLILFDCLIAFGLLRLKPIFNIGAGFLIGALSFALTAAAILMELFPIERDPYAITSAITYNAIFSIIFWEIAYRLKIRYAEKLT